MLVGVTARGLGDRVATPLDADAPGVEVHANVIDNLAAGDFIYRSAQRVAFAGRGLHFGRDGLPGFAFLNERASASPGFLSRRLSVLAHLTWAYEWNGLEWSFLC